MSNDIIIRFIREYDCGNGSPMISDAIMRIMLYKKSFTINFKDSLLSQDDTFRLYSVEKLIEYINNTMKVAQLDHDVEGRFKYIQVSIPRYPDIILKNDSKIIINAGKLSHAIRSVTVFK